VIFLAGASDFIANTGEKGIICVLGKHRLDMWCSAARQSRAALHQDILRGGASAPAPPRCKVYLLTTKNRSFLVFVAGFAGNEHQK